MNQPAKNPPLGRDRKRDDEATFLHTELAEQVTLQGVDETVAAPAPANIRDTWVGYEFDTAAEEQTHLWQATGTENARDAVMEAAGLAPQADAAAHLLTGHAAILDQATTELTDTTDALSAYTRRPPGAKRWHYAAKTALLAGDIAGISAAAIYWGDDPTLSVMLAVSTSTAAVLTGLVGSEVKDLRGSLRRKTDPDQLSPQQKRFQHLFTGADAGARIVKGVVLAAGATGLLIATGIASLRSEVEHDPIVGLIYGGFALAVCTGSFLESFHYADEIADQLDSATKRYLATLTRHQALAASAPWKSQLEQSAAAASIGTEHEQRGLAARLRLKALKWGIYRRNPGILGHGPHPTETPAPAEPPAGRLRRTSPAKGKRA